MLTRKTLNVKVSYFLDGIVVLKFHHIQKTGLSNVTLPRTGARYSQRRIESQVGQVCMTKSDILNLFVKNCKLNIWQRYSGSES